MPGNRRLLVVGSNNWTQSGLLGDNLEASVLIDCHETERITQDARAHIAACHLKSEPFNPARMRYYRAIQRRLQPPRIESDHEDFPGMEELLVTVIHAEDGRQNATAPLRVFVPVRSSQATEYFQSGRQVWLYLYPRNSLFGAKTPPRSPELFRGAVSMFNDSNTDSPVQQRAANCSIADLNSPVLRDLPGNVPTPGSEVAQVIALLHPQGPSQVPLFHLGEHRPKLKVDVKFRPSSDEKQIELPRRGGAINHSSAEEDGDDEMPVDRMDELLNQLWNWQPPDYQKPDGIAVKTNFQIANNAFWPESSRDHLRGILYERPDFNASDEPDISFKEVSRSDILSRYVYRVTFYLNERRLTAREQQPGLFS